MTLTTAQLKAAIEAKIAAATGATTLEDLTLIKRLADTWLANNSGGSIAGYSSLVSLLQTRQNALTGSSTIDDITLTSASAFPPVVGKSLVWKTQTFLTSGTFTRPAKMVGDTAWVTASAGGGGGATAGTLTIRGACGGSWCKDRSVTIPSSGSTSVLIGSGGNIGSNGGSTSFGSQIILVGGSRASIISTFYVDNPSTPSVLDIIYFVGVSPGYYFMLAKELGVNEHTAIYSKPEMVNGYSGAGFSYSNPVQRVYCGPAAGYFGSPTSIDSPAASPSNTGCGGHTAFAGSAGRLDISWWEYE